MKSLLMVVVAALVFADGIRVVDILQENKPIPINIKKEKESDSGKKSDETGGYDYHVATNGRKYVLSVDDQQEQVTFDFDGVSWRPVSEEYLRRLDSTGYDVSGNVVQLSDAQLGEYSSVKLSELGLGEFVGINLPWMDQVTLQKFSQFAKTLRPFRLASIEPTSVFILLDNAEKAPDTIAERFYNGKDWVYVRHFTKPLVNITSISTQFGRLYVTTRDGELYERRSNASGLHWATLNPDFKMKGVGCRSGKRRSSSTFYLSEDGDLYERGGSLPGSTRNAGAMKWYHYETYFVGFPDKLPLTVVADAESLEPNLLFFIGENGNLFEGVLNHRFKTVQIRNLGHPGGIPLAPFKGCTMKSEMGPSTNTNGANGANSKSSLSTRWGSGGPSLFLLALTGDLVELAPVADSSTSSASSSSFDTDLNRQNMAGDRYQWIVHGKPNRREYLTTPPGPCMGDKSIFLVTSHGSLVERRLVGDEWVWLDHGKPPRDDSDNQQDFMEAPQYLSLQNVTGETLDKDRIFFLAVDGRLAERVLVSESHSKTSFGTWTWKLHQVPEHHPNVRYCAGEACLPQQMRG